MAACAIKNKLTTLPEAIARKITTRTENYVTYPTANNDGTSGVGHRGATNDYYVKDGDNYKRIDRDKADYLSRQGISIYWQDRNYFTVVEYAGHEIDRISGLV